MELLLLFLILLLLGMFGYAQQERGVFRTPGSISLNDDEVISGR